MPALIPEVVKHPMTADRGHPAAEPSCVTAEPREIPGDTQPCLGGEIFGRIAYLRPQVANQPGMDRPVQQPERVLIALLCRTNRRRQFEIVCTGI